MRWLNDLVFYINIMAHTGVFTVGAVLVMIYISDVEDDARMNAMTKLCMFTGLVLMAISTLAGGTTAVSFYYSRFKTRTNVIT